MAFNVWVNRLEEEEAFTCFECENCDIVFTIFEEGPTVKLCKEHKNFLVKIRDRMNSK